MPSKIVAVEGRRRSSKAQIGPQSTHLESASASEDGAPAGVADGLRLCCRCALSRWPAESADMSESSPAMTVAATTVASSRELAPGLSREAPATPSIPRHALCGARMVPPPTVPTSIDGIVHEMWRSSPAAEMSVMHCDDSTFCAASCPVARKSAVTMFDACALNPPSAPAIAEPMRFLAVLSCTIASTLVLSVLRTMSPLIVASTTTEQPRPSTQFTAADFLSQHMFPESPSTCMSLNSSPNRSSSTALTPLDTIFIPIASPVVHANRAYASLPATATCTEMSRAKRDVVAKRSLARRRFASSTIHA
mmetsp:Transcript_35788/g.83528  ORF Transcript_35788/g.83528 Transcript_35788/m.83528 type:complete len:308 (+) Transcript_35788:566-1489(+)